MTQQCYPNGFFFLLEMQTEVRAKEELHVRKVLSRIKPGMLWLWFFVAGITLCICLCRTSDLGHGNLKTRYLNGPAQ